MKSLGVQIGEAVEERLKVGSVTLPSGVFTPPPGLVVERNRVGVVYPGDVRAGPLIVVMTGGEPKIERAHWKSPVTVRTMTLLVGVFAMAQAQDSDDATDEPYLWMIRALQSDPSLGGLCNWIAEDSFETSYSIYQDSAEIVAARECKIQISFHTRTDDPAVRANP